MVFENPNFILYLFLAAGIGVALTYIIDFFIDIDDISAEHAAELRVELRTDNKELQAELRKAEEETEKWKDNYYELLIRYEQLEDEHEYFKKQ